MGILRESNRLRVEGDKRTGRHRAAKVLPKCIGRCVLRAERFDMNLLRSVGPTRARRVTSPSITISPMFLKQIVVASTLLSSYAWRPKWLMQRVARGREATPFQMVK